MSNEKQLAKITRRTFLGFGVAVAAHQLVGHAAPVEADIDNGSDSHIVEQIPNDPVEVVDYDNAKLLGQVPGDSADSVVHSGSGAFGITTNNFGESGNNSYSIILGTTMPEGAVDQLEIRKTDAVDTPAILQLGLNGQNIFAGFVTKANQIVVRAYSSNLQTYTDSVLGEGLNDGRMQYPLGGFAMLQHDDRQVAVVANISAENNNPEQGGQPSATINLVIADLEKGEKIDIQSTTPIRSPGESLAVYDERIAEITKDGEDFLTLTNLGLWRTAFNRTENKWETTFEPFGIPNIGPRGTSHPHSVGFDHKTGNILYAISSSDIYFGVMRRNENGTGWTSKENQLVLKRTDDEKWNGIIGGPAYTSLPLFRSAGSDDVVLMAPSMLLGESFDKLFGIQQEPVVYRNGRFSRSNPGRIRSDWELLARMNAREALVVTSNRKDPVLNISSISIKNLAPKPIPTLAPMPMPTESADPASSTIFIPRLDS